MSWKHFQLSKVFDSIDNLGILVQFGGISIFWPKLPMASPEQGVVKKIAQNRLKTCFLCVSGDLKTFWIFEKFSVKSTQVTLCAHVTWASLTFFDVLDFISAFLVIIHQNQNVEFENNDFFIPRVTQKSANPPNFAMPYLENAFTDHHQKLFSSSGAEYKLENTKSGLKKRFPWSGACPQTYGRPTEVFGP